MPTGCGGRHPDHERQLDGVDVAEPGGDALVEQGAGERLVGGLGEPVEHLVEVGLLGPAQVGAEVADDAVLLAVGTTPTTGRSSR